MLWPEHLMRPAGGRVYNTRHHVHIIEIVFLRVGFLRGLGVPSREKQPSYGTAESPPIRKSRAISADVELFQMHLRRYQDGDTAFCFTPSQNARSDHEFTVGTQTVFYFSIIKQKEERKKKNQSS